MPLGQMTRDNGEAIGNTIGGLLDVEGEVEGFDCRAQYMQIKVRMDIRKPLIRGVMMMVEVNGVEKETWCPLVHEFLPNFYYTCGIIGHPTDYVIQGWKWEKCNSIMASYHSCLTRSQMVKILEDGKVHLVTSSCDKTG
jgi:hypothetical protein